MKSDEELVEDVQTIYPAVIDNSDTKKTRVKNKSKRKSVGKKQDIIDNEIIAETSEEKVSSENTKKRKKNKQKTEEKLLFL